MDVLCGTGTEIAKFCFIHRHIHGNNIRQCLIYHLGFLFPPRNFNISSTVKCLTETWDTTQGISLLPLWQKISPIYSSWACSYFLGYLHSAAYSFNRSMIEILFILEKKSILPKTINQELFWYINMNTFKIH